MLSREDQMQPLRPDFQPGPHDVICARGKEAKSHEGNRRYTALIDASLDRYSQATSKHEKTVIVSQILDLVRHASPDGGFVKQQNGRWHEVGDHMAREKIGQNLRDRLSHMYKSSTKAKRKRRANTQQEMASDIESLILSNKTVAGRLDKLNTDLQVQGKTAPQVFVAQMFSDANYEILEAMKKDEGLVHQFVKAEEEIDKLTKEEHDKEMDKKVKAKKSRHRSTKRGA